jgi:hypothetical protein
MQASGLDLVTLHIYSPPIKNMKTYQFATMTGADNSAPYSVQMVGMGEGI